MQVSIPHDLHGQATDVQGGMGPLPKGSKRLMGLGPHRSARPHGSIDDLEQMFEPPMNGRGDLRQAALKDEFRSSLQEGVVARRRDALGVETRAAAVSEGRPWPLPIDPESSAASIHASEQPSDLTLGAVEPVAFPNPIPNPQSQGPISSKPGLERQPQAPVRPDSTVRLLQEGHPTALRVAMETGPKSLMPKVVGTTGSMIRSTSSIAEQIGKWLGQSTGSERESVRVPGPALVSLVKPQRPSRPSERQATSTGSQHSPSSAAHLDAAEGSDSASFGELIRSIRIRTGQRSSFARVRLEPPELGRMTVDVRLNRETLRIDVRTETAAATELVRSRAAELRDALRRHGLQVEHLEVTEESTAHSSLAAHRSHSSLPPVPVHSEYGGAIVQPPTSRTSQRAGGSSGTKQSMSSNVVSRRNRMDLQV